MLKRTLFLSAFVSVTTMSALAFAQDETGGAAAPPPPPPDQTAPASNEVQQAPPVVQQAPPVVQQAPPAPPKETEEPPGDPGGRVRWGVSASLGWHLPQSMFTIGGEGRIGYQVSNVLSAYAAIGGTGGFGFGADVGVEGVSVSVNAISYYYLGAIAEAMFGDIFYVGGGPVIARGAIGGFTTGISADGVAEVTQVSSAGFKPGLNLRFGLGFGKPRSPSYRRGGFNLGVDALLLFHPSAVFVTTRADGQNGTAGTSVTTSALGASLIPMLTLGYDSR
ncbi:hypothetical protein [Polyangium aurulentum]|uniref:hypothetical protein n=1 Tax=Polyangium aurulentum TaxID=2567896 RepID=UPI0010AEA0ED|nr:hypothetical protein [Polyangium aurulentum]UQA57278.1 hypothetical protein E8A73_039270 [Polyangium aurulentum]